MADVRAATESAGGTDVATYLTSGNVRLTSRHRTAGAVSRALEQSYARNRGFEVPTVVLTPGELVEIVRIGRDLQERMSPVGSHYVYLCAEPPEPAVVGAVERLAIPGEHCRVRGRAAYVLLDGNIHTSTLLRSKEFTALGQGTARTLGVLERLVDRWA